MNDNAVNIVMEALAKLMKMFQIERIFHLLCAVLSFAMLIYATTITIQQDGGIENGQLALLFGATGMITLSVARVSWFFNRAFDLVEAALRHMTDQRIEP